MFMNNDNPKNNNLKNRRLILSIYGRVAQLGYLARAMGLGEAKEREALLKAI